MTLLFIFTNHPVAEGQSISPPKPFGAVPSQNQLNWQSMETYAFIHFGINTFTNKEWGLGDEDPALFNPKNFDAEQIVKSIKQGRFKGVILTAKHHDGFCLWPTKTTTHNITKSPWRNGKGDLVKEISDACRKYGLKFGIYLSPWDRNAASYGTPAYVAMYKEQLTELLTNYGPVFETWHDGANGGDGYYGGARERRNIDRSTYYNWENIWAHIRKLQPNAVIFGDIGPDLRWVGNESGFAGDPCWQTFTPEAINPSEKPSNGTVKYWLSVNGTRNGKFWMPAETDFSIRPGWFWHQSENDKVKTADDLLKHYFMSVGRGASMLLNIPPDATGKIYKTDSIELKKFGDLLKQTFSVNLAKGAVITASNVRGNLKQYGTRNLLDQDAFSYWATDDAVLKAELTITLPKTQTFNIIRIKENTKLGQRIDSLNIDALLNGKWTNVAGVNSIGSNRLVRLARISTNKLRIRIIKSSASPALSDFALFAEPLSTAAPSISVSGNNKVHVYANRPAYQIRYTLDGSNPTASSKLFTGDLYLPEGGRINAAVFNENGTHSNIVGRTIGITKANWKITGSPNVNPTKLKNINDNNSDTFWEGSPSKNTATLPQEIVIDMGSEQKIAAFSYLPRQDGKFNGTIDRYALLGSNDGKNWEEVATGEFANIKANPIAQQVNFKKSLTARYLKFKALHVVEGTFINIAELDVYRNL